MGQGSCLQQNTQTRLKLLTGGQKMNIKSLLLGSAAALFAVSGAQAADAIIAAEPEPLEYVRVCDAFGTGFFYIPGTETCLKIGGYVRFQVSFGEAIAGSSDYDAFTDARVTVTASNDTEFGTLTSFIGLETLGNNVDLANADANTGGDFGVEEAYFELAGFKVGHFFSWWDDGLSGESDSLSTNALFNSISYTYEAGNFFAGVSVDELEGITTNPNGLGVAATASATLGGVTITGLVGYDTEVEELAVRGILAADVGPGVFQLAGVFATDSDGIAQNAYYSEAEWAVAVQYALRASDSLVITPEFQYESDVAFVEGVDEWTVGLTAEYAVTEGLGLLATVAYSEIDGGVLDGEDDLSGFIRLQRNF
jgi:hypothetical protein